MKFAGKWVERSRVGKFVSWVPSKLPLILLMLACFRLLPVGVSHERTAGSVALAQDRGKPISILGSGASFPAPLYNRWFAEYSKLHPDVQINFQSIGSGSGAGIRQFQQGLVDFAASDAAMTDEQIAAVKGGVVLLPMTAGSVVLIYNLPAGPSELKLSRDAYSKVFLGQITHWNDPIIANSNPGVKLPDIAITVISKSDASGTTFVFTSHLSAISESWRKGPGAGMAVNFPVGVAAKGTLGVAALVKQTPGAIGYVEYGYAIRCGLQMASLENRTGRFIKPDAHTGANALASLKLPANLRGWIPDPPGADAYPIVTYTWLILHRKYSDPNMAQTLKSVISFALSRGQSYSVELGYIPLPTDVVRAVSDALGQIS